MNLISRTHHSCERREYAFMVLQEYTIISRENVSFDSFSYDLLLREKRENKVILELLNNKSLIWELLRVREFRIQ